METFIQRWQNAGGTERANYQMFFAELCDALGVERPNPQGGELAYGFDLSITIYTPSGQKRPGFIDFYKENHFIIEAKQGSEQSGKGTAKRGTQAYLKAMEAAFVQAVAYARNVPSKPPFLLTCDIGSHFEVWMGFSGDYGGYGARREIALTDLRKREVFDEFVDIFTNPQARNPEKIAAKVTREVAADLAELAKSLEVGHEPQEVAQFLMRCIFTMFAEDVGLLKEQLFTQALRERWLPNPKSFKSEVERLWQAMNLGEPFGFSDRLLRFNGGLFAEATAFELTQAQLEVLLKAAQRDWRNVEPAIFGTLLERALSTKERSQLGAHYTPRSYVERLVRPVVLEPLRDRWEIVQAEVNQILGEEPTKKQIKDAQGVLEGFLTELQQVKVLDPACGSGNFLYVTLDLIKQLESEVFKRLADVMGADQLRIDAVQVNPSQFLGIEINPRAAAIADLVIWIGYLQWHFRRFGDVPPIEPVLREYQNIECRDAVLDWDERVPDVDKDGKVRTRWGGRMIKSPVTGEEIPDVTDQVTIWKYVNARQTEWKEADYVVSNPPFIGNASMRDRLGDGYVKALRNVYENVPDTVDFVMYWWHNAAELVRLEKINRFGFITTKSIRQTLQRKVIDFHLNQKNPIRLFFAIPEHPWAEGDAAVTVAMTAAELHNFKGNTIAYVGEFFANRDKQQEHLVDENELVVRKVEEIFSNLQSGVNITNLPKLSANSKLSCPGVKLHGKGFKLTAEQKENIEEQVVHSYLNWDDLADRSRNLYIIDLFGLTEGEVQIQYPQAYQWVYENVKPERDQNNRPAYKKNWWIFGEPRAQFRPALENLSRYIVTGETSKHRTFIFLPTDVVPDNMLTVFAFDDAFALGILSSQIHTVWALAAGGDHSGNTPRYNKTVCFDPFPFPDPTESQKQKIRDLGDRLDSHRKRVQATHPEVTITAMYNLLEKLRAGTPLDDKDKAFNQKALVSTLKQIHDELDTAVFEAYGWEDLIGGQRSDLPSPQPSPEGRGSKSPSPAPLLLREKGLGDEGYSQLAGKQRQIPPVLLQRARELRQQQTPAEQILWSCLRDRQLCDTKFRRQHNLGQFIADFYCHIAKLVIELDGSIHDTQEEADQNRDHWMQSNHITVLRFKNEQIFQDLETVLLEIAQYLPSPQPSPEGRGSKSPSPSPAPLLPREKGLGDEGTLPNLNEQILQRLVTLNTQRATEERNGIIRWLRPDYQAPTTTQPEQQTLIDLPETPTPVTSTKLPPFPKDFKDQLAAIRDLLRTQGGEWTIDAIATQFKNASRSKAKIQTSLEALETLGIVTQHSENSEAKWYFTELQTTA
jgi:very-short-patch-repair endonuclease